MIRTSIAVCAALTLASVASAGLSLPGHDRTHRNLSSHFSLPGTSSNTSNHSGNSSHDSRDVCSNPCNLTPPVCPPSQGNKDCDRVARECSNNQPSGGFDCPRTSVCSNPPCNPPSCNPPRDCNPRCDVPCQPPCHNVPAPSGSIALAAAGLALCRRRRAR